LHGIVDGQLREDIHGVTAVFLTRHCLELALKYTLFHSRWLKDETTNAADDEVEPVGKDHHKLTPLWDKLRKELSKTPSLVGGLDLKFVGDFIKDLHDADERGMRFRYPGEQLPVVALSDKTLGIHFDVLLLSLTRAYDILQTLDTDLRNQYGINRTCASNL
jgi:hypothetical protein